jgi:MoxR-like ATPase
MTNPPKLEDFLPSQLKVNNPSRKLHHIFEEDDCYALWAAYSAGRPLLVRGKPGTGKSQMARAIAEQLGWAFVSEVVRGSTELSDLHWHFDAIGRLGEAQARAMPGASTDDQAKDMLDPLNFLSPGAFWWAFNWQSAQKQYGKCCTGFGSEPEKPDTNLKKGKAWAPDAGGVVLLLDEIDKAEPDLPNGLLEPLGLYQFTVPYIDRQDPQASCINPIKADPSRLLVIITTNEERELPKAFVRRCFVHTLKMEESSEALNPDTDKPVEKRHQWLIDRGRLHFGQDIAEPVYHTAAELLWQDRSASSPSQYPPGLAEYIDLLSALQSLNHQQQQERLKIIAKYALKKDLEQ